MPRDGSGVYSAPSGTLAVSTTTISSTAYNAFVADLTTLANEARPVSAGGTGQTSIAGVQGSFKIAPYDGAATISGTWDFTGTFDFTGATVTGLSVAPPDADYGDITVAAGAWSIDAGAVTTAKVADGAVTLAKMADMATASFIGRDTAGTGSPEVLTPAQARTILGVSGAPTVVSAVATTSGQTINLATGLSGVRAFSVFFQNVSLSGANDSVLVQLGTSGGFVTTGYVSESAFGTAVSSDTNGFLSRLLGSSRELIGEMRFTHMGGNLWRASHATNYGVGGGYITLAGELTQIRLQVSGTPTDSFDAGSAQVIYET